MVSLFPYQPSLAECHYEIFCQESYDSITSTKLNSTVHVDPTESTPTPEIGTKLVENSSAGVNQAGGEKPKINLLKEPPEQSNMAKEYSSAKKTPLFQMSVPFRRTNIKPIRLLPDENFQSHVTGHFVISQPSGALRTETAISTKNQVNLFTLKSKPVANNEEGGGESHLAHQINVSHWPKTISFCNHDLEFIQNPPQQSQSNQYTDHTQIKNQSHSDRKVNIPENPMKVIANKINLSMLPGVGTPMNNSITPNSRGYGFGWLHNHHQKEGISPVGTTTPIRETPFSGQTTVKNAMSCKNSPPKALKTDSGFTEAYIKIMGNKETPSKQRKAVAAHNSNSRLMSLEKMIPPRTHSLGPPPEVKFVKTEVDYKKPILEEHDGQSQGENKEPAPSFNSASLAKNIKLEGDSNINILCKQFATQKSKNGKVIRFSTVAKNTTRSSKFMRSSSLKNLICNDQLHSNSNLKDPFYFQLKDFELYRSQADINCNQVPKPSRGSRLNIQELPKK